MKKTILQIAEEFRKNLDAFQWVLKSTPPPRLSFKKDESWWSVLEVVHHVALVNALAIESLRRLVEGVRAEAPGQSVVEIQESLEDIDNSWVLSNLNAPPGSEPDGEISAAQAESLLLSSHQGAAELLELGKTADLSHLTTPSKLFGTLNFYERIYFLAMHERTHLYQIKMKLAETVLPESF